MTSHIKVTKQQGHVLDEDILPWPTSPRSVSLKSATSLSTSSFFIESSSDAFDDSFLNSSTTWEFSFDKNDELWNNHEEPVTIKEEDEEAQRRAKQNRGKGTSRNRRNYAKLLLDLAIETAVASTEDEQEHVKREIAARHHRKLQREKKDINLTSWQIREQEKHLKSKRPSGAKKTRRSSCNRRLSLEPCASIYSNEN